MLAEPSSPARPPRLPPPTLPRITPAPSHEPNPPPIFELDCTQGPQQSTYVWKELNYRDPADAACTYQFDPWTQDWAAGLHQFTLMYRESAAVSRIWVTNTDGTPP